MVVIPAEASSPDSEPLADLAEMETSSQQVSGLAWEPCPVGAQVQPPVSWEGYLEGTCRAAGLLPAFQSLLDHKFDDIFGSSFSHDPFNFNSQNGVARDDK